MLPIITFVVGLAVGLGIARAVVKRHWEKTLKADREASFAQYTSELSEERQKRESAQKAQFQLEQQIGDYQQQVMHWREQSQAHSEEARSQRHQIENLNRQLSRQSQQQAEIVQALEDKLASQETNHLSILSLEKQKAQDAVYSIQSDCDALRQASAELQEELDLSKAALDTEKRKTCDLQAAQSDLEKKWSKHREDNSAAIEIRVDLENKNRDLSYENSKLRRELDRLRELTNQKGTDSQNTQEKASLNLVKVVEKLFPEIQLLHHSKHEIRQHRNKFINLLSSFKQLESKESLPQHKKIQGADYDLWEYWVGRQGRVYYHCAKTDEGIAQYKVVVAWKHDKQEQQQVIDWFNQWLKRYYS